MTNETSARHGWPYLTAGQAQKELTHNEALALIDIAADAAAVSIGSNIPPPAPQVGQCWILGGSPTGAWSGRAESIACWTASGWRFAPPLTGMRVWVADQQLWAVREAAGWTLGLVRASSVRIGSDQVVGPRLASVESPTGGETVDSQARLAIGQILQRLQDHGLIAAS